jgi:membrane-associated protein
MAIAGDSVGYAFGKKVGPSLFSRDDSFFFHKKHAERAKLFYEKYGVKTIILARFIPIVRTFAPIVAGIGNMSYRTFIMFNAIGGTIWILSMTLLGFFVGKLIPSASKYIHIIVFVIIGVSFVPVFIEYFKTRLKNKRDMPR